MFDINTNSITRIALGLERFRRSMETTAANRIREQVVQYAALSKAPNGSPWKALSAEYKRRKARMNLPAIPNKRVTGGFLNSVVNRNGLIAPDAAHLPQGKGLEKKRISFQVAQATASIIEATYLKQFNAVIGS